MAWSGRAVVVKGEGSLGKGITKGLGTHLEGAHIWRLRPFLQVINLFTRYIQSNHEL